MKKAFLFLGRLTLTAICCMYILLVFFGVFKGFVWACLAVAAGIYSMWLWRDEKVI